MRQDLQHAIEVRQAGAEAVHELVEHDFAIGQCIFVVVDLVGEIRQEFTLHAAEDFGRLTAGAGPVADLTASTDSVRWPAAAAWRRPAK